MKKILIIEDEQDIVKVLYKKLTDNKFEVVWAQDAYAGVKSAHDEKPDLIILDLMLPAGGGLKTLQNIRNSLKTAFIPVIVLTGMKDEQYKKQVLEAGVEAYMEKPYDFSELLGVINKALEGK
jgi:DNA-binding response OmpR family regulator